MRVKDKTNSTINVYTFLEKGGVNLDNKFKLSESEENELNDYLILEVLRRAQQENSRKGAKSFAMFVAKRDANFVIKTMNLIKEGYIAKDLFDLSENTKYSSSIITKKGMGYYNKLLPKWKKLVK
ncbi:MAG: hypothetical protein [Caudoviricetes sp.]|nr:MAG: hypothetical protein [Caudoviricetes sp.]